MEWLTSVVDQVLLFFQYIWDFITQGIYDLVKDGLVVLTKAAIYAWFKGLLFLVDIGYTVSRELIDSLGINAMVRSMYAALPAKIALGLQYFGVPQGLNIIFTALSTRFCMRFIPFMGG